MYGIFEKGASVRACAAGLQAFFGLFLNGGMRLRAEKVLFCGKIVLSVFEIVLNYFEEVPNYFLPASLPCFLEKEKARRAAFPAWRSGGALTARVLALLSQTGALVTGMGCASGLG